MKTTQADRIIATIRGTSEEHEFILEQAKLHGLSLNQYIRFMLNMPPRDKRIKQKKEK